MPAQAPKVYCVQCGKLIKRNRRHTRLQHLSRKYCSDKCRILNKRVAEVEKECLNCHKHFLTAYKWKKYCSKDCSREFIKKKLSKKVKKTCKQCGKEFYCTQAKLRQTSCVFCSNECCAESQRKTDEEKFRTAKNWNLQKKYGISIDDYDELIVQQQGKCKICGEKCETLAVDHDHKTGKVRGLLCIKCNLGLGYFNDETVILKKAIKYLSPPKT